ncbi:hypothetical protein EG68_07452 [Paragonimus skrjabini miyazakii]|uniref:Uncharacterized protein n=1 Tax=Paragonimus skrjabini miyazakii TaxID=59628 RepID=A0A8S9YLW3_9TREM|nr:hypothetical protein EG68_07452 [Paragonimus skrjabini miyazakii]
MLSILENFLNSQRISYSGETFCRTRKHVTRYGSEAIRANAKWLTNVDLCRSMLNTSVVLLNGIHSERMACYSQCCGVWFN